MLHLLKRQRSKRTSNKEIIYWTDSGIPAKVFFDILFNNASITKLGEAPIEKLESVFSKIVDEYVLIEGSTRITDWYTKQCRIARIGALIEVTTTILYHICYTPMTRNERLKCIEDLNRIEERPETEYAPAKLLVKFDINKPILDEVQRVQDVVLGRLRTEVRHLSSAEKKDEESAKYSFEAELVDVENALGRTIDDQVSLKKYLELKKSAIKKVNSQRKPYKNGR